ncbi:hypothetical protein L2E82_48440 [Cichorium intybus]|uniref:Uncharacterized protein n=1 Tax=Cichorium intybus TaxID=13427 RepID=A0ACB8Z2B4_CICIN|nr:hypothetical protein L2E82_48440 [Cichorium intybus]
MEWTETKETQFERIAWLKITGVPLFARDDENFQRIVRRYGKVLSEEDHVWNCSILSHGLVGVLTTIRMKINEEISVNIREDKIRIGVSQTEDDWNLFYKSTDVKNNEEVWSTVEEDDAIEHNDDEYGIFDTWMQQEDGEFQPDSPIASLEIMTKMARMIRSPTMSIGELNSHQSH